MSAGAALSSIASGKQPGQIIRPGAQLARAAQALAEPARAEGRYPFQWLYPGPNSAPAIPNGRIAIPAIVAPATSATGTIFQYEVPEGYKLVLTDILFNAFAADWNPGSGQLTFTLQLLYSTGPRNVEFFQNVPFGFGLAGYPWPIKGRLEFNSLDVLALLVTNTGIPTPGPNDYAYGALNGFTYPAFESA